MKKELNAFLLMVLAWFAIAFHFCSAGDFARPTTKQITIFGAISAPQGTEELSGIPISYKGGEYAVVSDKENKIKSGQFEIYDDKKPAQLYILIVKSLKIPCENCFDHFEVDLSANYKLYKLTKYAVEIPDLDPLDVLKNKQMIDWRDSWRVQEVFLKEGQAQVPDNCVIIFMDPEFVDHLEVKDWLSAGTTMKIPTIILKESCTKNNQKVAITKEMIKDMCKEACSAFIDFRLFHKKPFKAIVPFAQNRLISMPFTPRGYNC